jgi:thiol-disulfide isomerase/thioredoxin
MTMTCKRAWIPAVLFAALLTAAPCLAGKDPLSLKLASGDPVALTGQGMMNVDGERVSITDVAGEKGTLVLFTCNHCPWVKAWEDRMVALGNEYRKKGVGVIAVNSNDPAAAGDTFRGMQERAREKGFRFPYVVDATSDVARAFGATRTPEAFLFDGKGRLVYHGAIDDSAKDPAAVESHYLRDALAAVASGREPAVRQTKALGCSIKFRPEM